MFEPVYLVMNIFFTNRKVFYVQMRSLLLQLNVENRAKKVHAKNRALSAKKWVTHGIQLQVLTH